MFLLILEDWSMVKVKEITEDDKRAVVDGMLEIVDMDTEQKFTNTGWRDIEVYEEG
jgi:hypothetical protein